MSYKKFDLDNNQKIKESEFRNTFDNFFIESENNEDQQNKNDVQTNKKYLILPKGTKKKKYNKSKDNSFVITYDTKIFSIPFFSNDSKSKKNRNYEQLLLELNKLFNSRTNENNIYQDSINIKQNKDENKKQNNNKKYIDLPNNILDYISIIKKPINERTMADLYLINKCLSKTKIGKYFKTEFNNNKEIFEKLITFCSVEIRHKKYYQGEKVFNIGDLPDNFYIILQGKVDIVKPLQKKVSISGNNYFCYLMDLLKNGDNYTFNLCIENNQKTYAIEKEDISLLPYIFISINLEKINIDLPIDFSEVLSIVNIPPENLGLTGNQVFRNYYIKEKISNIKSYFPIGISSDLFEKYYFIFDKFEKNEVIIYDYEKFLSLETNDYFGDSAIDSKTTRNATIIASEDTDLGYLEMNLYQHFIGEEKSKNIKRQLNFLMKNFFFRTINPRKFQTKYFGYFILNNLKKGDIIYRENETPKFVYFIEEGKVELSSSKNILEMESTIQILRKKLDDMNTLLIVGPHKNEIDEEKNKELIESEKKELLYDKINSNFITLNKHLNQKDKNKILILKKNECLGIISFYFDCPCFTDCVVYSNSAKIFKIDIKYLNEIITHEKKCIDDLNKKVKYKLHLFEDRFFSVNNTKLLIADKKESIKLDELIKIKNNIILKKMLHKHDFIYNNLNNENKKTKVDINKFKELYKKIINKNHDNRNDNKSNKTMKSTLPSIKSEKVFIINNILMTDRRNRRNSTLTRRKTNINKIKNISKNKSNTIKFLDLNNKNGKNIDKKRINMFAENGNDTNRNKKINKRNKNYNSIEMKQKKNDSFIIYYEKYFNNKNLTAKTPLIFSKSILMEDNKNFDNDKNDSTSDIKNSNINNKQNINSNINYEKNKFLKNSRNSKYSTFNYLNKDSTLSTFRNINNSKNNSQKRIFPLLKKKNFLYKNNKFSDTSIHFNKNINKNIMNKEKVINSYTDKNYKFNVINKMKNINHPYYSPAVLSKKEKYNIFTRNEFYFSKNIKKRKENENLNELGFFSFSSEKRNNEDKKNITCIKFKKVL